MAAGYLELFIDQGETFSANISLSGMNDASYNLASYSAKCDVRKSYWSEDISASFNTIINIEEGEIVMSMNANTTQELSPGRYVYDLFISQPSTGYRDKILEGILFVDPSATKI